MRKLKLREVKKLTQKHTKLLVAELGDPNQDCVITGL